jgi:sulfur-oxidizing protein SoxA
MSGSYRAIWWVIWWVIGWAIRWAITGLTPCAIGCAFAFGAVTATAAAAAGGAPAAPADARRSGADFMSPALQALQRDDGQNPGQLWVSEGESLWRRTAANGRSCAGCHSAASVRDVAARYPAFDATLRRPLTLAGRIDQCRQRRLDLLPQGAEGPEVLALSAWLAHQARDLPIAPPKDSNLTPWRVRGEQLWTQRMGQLNLACAQCHDQRAGQRLGGALIPQAHPMGYPVYRLEWQTLGSLNRRLRGCLTGVRAEPFAPDADEWTALELYLMQRAAGLPMEGVGVRP